MDDSGFVLVEAVSEDVAGPHLREHLDQAQLPCIGVHHQREAGGITDLACPLQPFSPILTHELRGQTDLDSDDVVAVLLAHADRALDIGVPDFGELADASAQHPL